MNDLLHGATAVLARFLQRVLPPLSPDWWRSRVADRLTDQQQRTVREQGYKSLEQLDLSALLRVFDQNWYDLSAALSLPREGRNWVKEMQAVRNRWAHSSPEPVPASQVYRDADTLGRLLELIGADQGLTRAVNEAKAAAVVAMASALPHSAPSPCGPSEPSPSDGRLGPTSNHVATRSGSSRVASGAYRGEVNHPRVTDFTFAGFRRAGFSGFVPIESLRAGRLAEVPNLPGVYVVVRAEISPPVFLARSPAGHFKGQDPTEPAEVLQHNWVDQASVLYIGRTTDALLRRIKALLDFGAGRPAGHWGGRLIWQLADAGTLQVGWKPDGDPISLEHRLLSDFRRRHGARPFANLTGGRAAQTGAKGDSEAVRARQGAKVTLHRAIEDALKAMGGGWIGFRELANAIADAGSYRRADGDAATPSQIRLRAKNHPETFEIRAGNSAAVRLRGSGSA